LKLIRATIYTAAAATADYVIERFGKRGRRPSVFNLSTEGIHDLLDGKVNWIEGETGPCDAVICGVPLNFFATEGATSNRNAAASQRGRACRDLR